MLSLNTQYLNYLRNYLSRAVGLRLFFHVQICDTPNQFAYSDSAKDVNGQVLTLKVSSNNGGEVTVKDSEPIVLWMKGRETHAIISGPMIKLFFFSNVTEECFSRRK